MNMPPGLLEQLRLTVSAFGRSENPMDAATATIEHIGIFHFPLDMTASLSLIAPK